ncbi:MAG: hypothetical protein AAFY88_19720, partial [Acidobacteriota bacterium]
MKPRADRLVRLQWISLALWCPLVLATAVHLWLTWGFSGVRLVRSLAWIRGESLFPGFGDGWIHLSLYGPVAAAAFVPAVWLDSPASAIAAGQLLAALYFFAPALLLIRAAARSTDAAPGGAVAAFVFVGAVTLDLWSLRYAALTVHADGPALALAALAAWSLYRFGAKRLGLGAAAFFAVAAVWAKQVAVGVPLALAVFIGAVFGVGALLRFAAWGSAWTAASFALVTV